MGTKCDICNKVIEGYSRNAHRGKLEFPDDGEIHIDICYECIERMQKNWAGCRAVKE